MEKQGERKNKGENFKNQQIVLTKWSITINV